MAEVPLACPIEPHKMPKPLRRGMEDITRRVALVAVTRGLGKDLLLRVYLSGIYHGVELSKRPNQGEAK